MANAIQPSARQAYLDGNLDWAAHDFKIVAVDSTYVYSSAHNFLDDVGGGSRLAASGNLTGKTSTDGYANADDVVLSSVAGGDTVAGVWLFRDTGVEATSELVTWLDTKSDAAAVSLATDGGDITVRWHALGIFRL